MYVRTVVGRFQAYGNAGVKKMLHVSVAGFVIDSWSIRDCGSEAWMSVGAVGFYSTWELSFGKEEKKDSAWSTRVIRECVLWMINGL